MTIFSKIRYYKCCITIELIWGKELILLKVTTAKNAWFAINGFLIMDSNFKIIFAMVVMIWQFCVFIKAILLLSLFKMLITIVLFITSEAINLFESAVLEKRVYIQKNIVSIFSLFYTFFLFLVYIKWLILWTYHLYHHISVDIPDHLNISSWSIYASTYVWTLF